MPGVPSSPRAPGELLSRAGTAAWTRGRRISETEIRAVNEIIQAIRQFFDYFRLWVIVAPWEQVLRVRLGKRVDLLAPGIHWRFSVIDSIYTQSVRLRICQIGRSTVMTKDGSPITYTASLGYSIQDIQKLYSGLHHAEDTVQNFARAEIASFISTHEAAECKQQELESSVDAALKLDCYGLSDVKVYITELMNVRTYRVIGDAWYGGQGAALDVEAATK